MGIAGPVLLPEEAALFRAFPQAGVILFARNIQDAGQVAALIASLRGDLQADAEIMVDQEGGRVARLRPPDWQAHPAAATIGKLFDGSSVKALRVAWLTGALIGLDCGATGFTIVATPVLDIAVPGAHDVIGDRAFAQHPVAVARLGRAVANGVLAAGLVPIGKHVPGHGRARVDSHFLLPKIADMDLTADVRPFMLNADLPWMMTGHLIYQALDADLPATLSAAVIETVIRGRIGFKGVLVTDDLAMKALCGTPADLATRALAAGCDLALYCSGDFALTEALLRTCPKLTEAAERRLRGGREVARICRQRLHPGRLLAERDRLLA